MVTIILIEIILIIIIIKIEITITKIEIIIMVTLLQPVHQLLQFLMKKKNRIMKGIKR